MDAAKVRAFNLRASRSVGWGDRIPADLVAKIPRLAEPPETLAFAEGVATFQALYFASVHDVDGMLGVKTWARMLEVSTLTAQPCESGMLRNGHPLDLPWTADAKLLTFDDDGGLDLHRDGGWTKNRRGVDIQWIVLHWNGNTATHCRNVLAGLDLSSHVGIDRDTVYQWLDIQHSAWHAGSANLRAVGIDICQSPLVERKASFYDKHPGEWDVEIIDNPTSRGRRDVLSLDGRTARSTHDAVKYLCDALDIPFEWPNHHDVVGLETLKREGFRGIIGHHHLSTAKWDVACWWSSIFD